MENKIIAPIALFKEYRAVQNLDKKIFIFKVWLEAMVKLNLSIHVGWLITQRGKDTPNLIKTQLVNFFQKPPSIGTCLALSRSINNLIEVSVTPNAAIMKFQKLHYQYDSIYSKLLEVRNSDSHAVRPINKEVLDDITSDMELITLSPFYINMKFKMRMIGEYLNDMGNLTKSTQLKQTESGLHVPILLIGIQKEQLEIRKAEYEGKIASYEAELQVYDDEIDALVAALQNELSWRKPGNYSYGPVAKKLDADLATKRAKKDAFIQRKATEIQGYYEQLENDEIPLFPLAVVDTEGELYFWNQRKNDHGKYSTYNLNPLELTIKNITSISGFPYEDWKRAADPLYLKYLNLRTNALEILPKNTEISLRNLADELQIVKRFEDELDLPSEEQMSQFQRISVLYNRTLIEINADIARHYYKYIVEEFIKEPDLSIRILVLDSILMLMKHETNSKRKAGLILYFFKEYALLAKLASSLNTDLYLLFEKRIQFSPKEISYYKRRNYLIFTRLYDSSKISFIINSTNTDDINIETKVSLNPVAAYLSLEQILKGFLNFNSFFSKLAGMHTYSLFGALHIISFTRQYKSYVNEQLSQVSTNNSINHVIELYNKLHEYTSLSNYLYVLSNTLYLFLKFGYFEEFYKRANIFHYLQSLFNEYKISSKRNSWISYWINKLSNLNYDKSSLIEQQDIANSMNRLEIQLLNYEINILIRAHTKNERAYRRQLYSENKTRPNNGSLPIDPILRIAQGYIWQPYDANLSAEIKFCRGNWLHVIGMHDEAIREFEESIILSNKYRFESLFCIAQVEGARSNAASCFSKLKQLKYQISFSKIKMVDSYNIVLDEQLAAFEALGHTPGYTMPPNWVSKVITTLPCSDKVRTI